MPEIGTTKHGGLGKRGRNAEGMTLIETLGAVCILGICIGGVCALVVQAKEMTDRARDHYTAINIAKNRMELARARGYDALGDFSEPPTVVDRKGSPDDEGDYQRNHCLEYCRQSQGDYYYGPDQEPDDTPIRCD